MRTQHLFPITVVVLLPLAACSDSLAPLVSGQPYTLSAVNGQPLPFALPGNLIPPPMIVEGSVTILNDSMAQRHERSVRTIVNSTGDSVPLVDDWTYTGVYRRLPGLVELRYLTWTAGQSGPLAPVETLFVSPRGLTLREVGFVAPLDSLVRLFCVPTAAC
jgi:hypothetical protein